MHFAGGQLAVFQGANEAPLSESYGPSEQRRKTANRPQAQSCDENGPATALLVGHLSIQICSAPTASPARTALPTAHFNRNKMHAISETGH
jgi:hypothetical protein